MSKCYRFYIARLDSVYTRPCYFRCFDGHLKPNTRPLASRTWCSSLLQSAPVSLCTVLDRLERRCLPGAKEGPQAAGGLLMESLEVSMVAGGSHGMRMGMPGTNPLPLGMLL